ncbi:hypothetical protein PTT_14156 [Pyrenophora teres f. teres 0-1]|uniref:Uncharacterized protein n=1 Tax=Pyrenophora teres f. teres (strain 0-1) TaxID=861557 RepID=E3RXM4_PYRTT|nr:hypothetical protein PTT_14156 [Pyrenophora teres f. teres 0-1]
MWVCARIIPGQWLLTIDSFAGAGAGGELGLTLGIRTSTEKAWQWQRERLLAPRSER